MTTLTKILYAEDEPDIRAIAQIALENIVVSPSNIAPMAKRR